MTAGTIEAAHLFVSGRVQGVGFRYHTRGVAMRLGLTGWVRNLPDGRVEIRAEGDPGRLSEFIAWCGTGPSAAQVSEVCVAERSPIPAPTSPGFNIR